MRSDSNLMLKVIAHHNGRRQNWMSCLEVSFWLAQSNGRCHSEYAFEVKRFIWRTCFEIAVSFIRSAATPQCSWWKPMTQDNVVTVSYRKLLIVIIIYDFFLSKTTQFLMCFSGKFYIFGLCVVQKMDLEKKMLWYPASLPCVSFFVCLFLFFCTSKVW